MKRITPDAGPKGPDADPNSPEMLARAEADRLHQMAVYGLTEDDFPDETIWLSDEDGDVPADE